MWRSIARFCSAFFALCVLTFVVAQAGCGKKEVNTQTPILSPTALPESKAGPILQQEKPSPQPTSVVIDPTFFPGTKSGKIFTTPAPKSEPTSQKKNTNNNDFNGPALPPSKSGGIFLR
jgi:hypothetical protein